MNTNKGRNPLLDIVKAVAMILVILGHAIQLGSGLGNMTALNLWIERFLLSFHMPLFMLVSGYLFYFSMQRHSTTEIFRKRLLMCGIPILTMAVIRHIRFHTKHMDTFITAFPADLFESLWFLWAVLVITAIMIVARKIGNDHWAVYLIAIAATLALPDTLTLRRCVFLLPTFWIGYEFAKRRAIFTPPTCINNTKTCIIGTVALLVVFALMLRDFSFEDTIYTSRYSLLGSEDIWKDLGRDFYRLAIGLTGSILTIIFVKFLLQKKWLSGTPMQILSSIGRSTLGLYIFQELIFLVLYPVFQHYYKGEWWMINSLFSFVLVFGSAYWLTVFAKKNRVLRFLFLGDTTK